MMNESSHPTDRTSFVAILLVGISIVAALLNYFTSIVVARFLGAAEFENYAVAIASIGLLTVIAEAGMGKLALKVIPEYEVSDSWALAHGYCRFSLRLVLLISCSLTLIVASLEAVEGDEFGNHSTGIAILFLPFIAVAGVGLDFVMANRAPILGSVIARIIMPLTSLGAIVLVNTYMNHVTAHWAVACYCCGSIVASVLCGITFWWTSPKALFQEAPEYEMQEWIREGISFASITFLAGWIFKIGLLVLEWCPINELEVAYYSAAIDSGCLILIVAKSTDKFFQPELSIVIETRDFSRAEKIRWHRYLVVVSAAALFTTGIVFFGKDILRLYGPGFEAGYTALCCVAIAAALSTVFSLAPAYLRFVGRGRLVMIILLVSGIALVILTAILGLDYGASGAGIAFLIVISAMTIAFLFYSQRDWNRKAEELSSAQDPTTTQDYDA